MIEAAILLPLFLMITFGVMEFGNMYMTRYQARDVASSVRDYLQGNPSASSADLQTFVTNLGFGSLKNTGPGEGNNVFTKINIQSGTTMMTAAEFDTLCSGGGVKSYANPWLGDSTADDKNDYYIHICYPYTYNTITPLSDLTVGAVPETKTLNSKALAYITREMSCPDGQVLQSFTGGSATCVARDRNYSCASGQTLEKIVDGVATCVAKDGTYTCASGQVLKEITSSGAVCVDRDAQYDCGPNQVLKNVNNGSATCVDMDKAYNCGTDGVLQATSAGGAVCVDKDRGWAACPGGQFAYAIANGVPYCQNVPKPSFTVRARTESRYKSKSNDCWDGHVVVGTMADGDAWCAPLMME
jgi:Flp pilus assembly protein TadG